MTRVIEDIIEKNVYFVKNKEFATRADAETFLRNERLKKGFKILLGDEIDRYVDQVSRHSYYDNQYTMKSENMRAYEDLMMFIINNYDKIKEVMTDGNTSANIS